jgi:hypothetical protein
VKAGISHWSQASGVTHVAYPPSDLPISDKDAVPGQDGALYTIPDIGFDASGKIYVVWHGVTAQMNPDTIPYAHIFASFSSDGGKHWTAKTDLTPVAGSENSSPSLAELVDANLHLVYSTNSWPGSFLQGTGGHPDTFQVIKYLKFPVANLLTPVDVREGVEVPMNYALEQNYPNPFNPSTSISFSIPTDQFVTLKVYNILGAEVATLVNGAMATGNHSVTFDASKFSSGIYFYRLEVGGQMLTRKMVLVH